MGAIIRYLQSFNPQFPHEKRNARPTTVVQQQLADNARFDPNWAHAYIQRPKIPQTATGNYVYATLGLTEFSPIGPGERVRQPMKTLASNGAPMVYYQAVPVQGMGGLIAGQIFSQPLYDPNAGSLVG